jgi:hypothetical protein
MEGFTLAFILLAVFIAFACAVPTLNNMLDVVI